MNLESLLAGLSELRGSRSSGGISFPSPSLPAVSLPRRSFLFKAGLVGLGLATLVGGISLVNRCSSPEQRFLPEGFDDLYLGMGSEELRKIRPQAELKKENNDNNNDYIERDLPLQDLASFLNLLYNREESLVKKWMQIHQINPAQASFYVVYVFADEIYDNSLKQITFVYQHKTIDFVNYLLFRDLANQLQSSFGPADRIGSNRRTWVASYQQNERSSTLLGDGNLRWQNKDFLVEISMGNGIDRSLLLYSVQKKEEAKKTSTGFE